MLTPDQIERLEAGPEMEALVAQYVMGWRCCDGFMTWKIPPTGGQQGGWATEADHFSRDIAAAWRVVERMWANGYGWNVEQRGEKIRAQFFRHYPGQKEINAWTFSPSAALSICRAALLAVLRGAEGVK